MGRAYTYIMSFQWLLQMSVVHVLSHAKRHLDRSSRFCKIPRRYITDTHTDTQTTETSVAMCRIYAMHTMRCKYGAIITVEHQWETVPHVGSRIYDLAVGAYRLSDTLFVTDRTSAAGNAIASVRPSVCSSVCFSHSISSEPTDRWPWTFTCE